MVMALEGIRILDWTQWQMGPVSTAMLADFGAEVIHIEDLNRGDPGRGLKMIRGVSTEFPGGKSVYFEFTNRNKKGIAIDLKKPEGKEVIYRLTRNADVFVHNFRQGVPERLGLDYEALSRYNPKLIYVAGSGYGPRGLEAQVPAYDHAALARAGAMFLSDRPGDIPTGLNGGIADQMGAIMISYGTLVALLARERLGIGQKVDVSHLSSMMALEALPIAMMLSLGHELPPRDRPKVGNPLFNYYECADGKWIALAMIQPDRQWPLVCKALGIENLERDPRFENADKRRENAEVLISIMDEIFRTQTRDQWIETLRGTGDIICSPVQTISDLPNDPQVSANEYIVEFNHRILGPIRILGIPIQLSKTPGAIRREAPEFGEHTEEVLIEVGGYTWQEIDNLKSNGVI